MGEVKKKGIKKDNQPKATEEAPGLKIREET